MEKSRGVLTRLSISQLLCGIEYQTFYQIHAWGKHFLQSGPIEDFCNLYIININKTLDRNEKNIEKLIVVNLQNCSYLNWY